MKPVTPIAVFVVLGGFVVSPLGAQPTGGAFGLSEMSEATRECVDCHKESNPGLYEQWGSSRHYRANVGCYECHSADPSDPDAYLHYDRMIAVIVSPAVTCPFLRDFADHFLGSFAIVRLDCDGAGASAPAGNGAQNGEDVVASFRFIGHGQP